MGGPRQPSLDFQEALKLDTEGKESVNLANCDAEAPSCPTLRTAALRSGSVRVGTELHSRSLVGCMKWQGDADGRAMLLRFVIALDADSPPVPLDELLCDE
jgi:hypothetical protein